MVNTLVTISHYLFAWVILTVLLSWLFALVYPFAASAFFRRGVVKAAFGTLFFSLLAPITAFVTLIILASPTWAHLIVEPHCHGDLCEPHSLKFVIETMLGTTLLAMALASVIVVALLMTSQLLTSHRRSQMLELLSEQDDSGYLRFKNSHRVAWCFGVFKPKVFLSSGLIESLNNEQRQAILAYELEHALRYHNLRKWLVFWSTSMWPKKIKEKIRHNFSQLCESICDLKAFSSLNHTMEAAVFLDTLRTVYGTRDGESNNTGQPAWRLRLNTLLRELSSQEHANETITLQGLAITALITFLWVLIITASVYLGHPLLETLLY